MVGEETREEVILVKDKKGKVIGFGKPNFLSHPKEVIKTIPVEAKGYTPEEIWMTQEASFLKEILEAEG